MIYKMSLLKKKIYKVKIYYKNSFKTLEYDIKDVLTLLDKIQNDRKIIKYDTLKIERLKKVYIAIK